MSVMKKNFIIVALTFFLTIPSLLLAQNTDKTVAKIRKDYAAAMEKIKFSGNTASIQNVSDTYTVVAKAVNVDQAESYLQSIH